MSDLCTSKTNFSNNLISNLVHFWSIILSHPLYFSYFIFFSPYLLKLATFLSPLLITTSILLLPLLAGLVNDDFSDVLAQCEEGFCGLEMYNVVFGSSEMAVVDAEQVVVLEEKSEEHNTLDQALESFSLPSKREALMFTSEVEEKRLDSFMKILNRFEKIGSNAEEENVEPLQGTKAVEEHNVVSVTRCGSREIGKTVNVTTRDSVKSIDAHSQRLGSFPPLDRNLGAYGSMRKDKVWDRMLVSKLYEERRGNVDGDEGMDSLWEKYENDSSKSKSKSKTKAENNKNKKIKKKKEDEFSEDEEDGKIDGQLCCLQALRFSSRKMSLGIGRPNLVRISKAIKGLGWLHHVKKHSKKVHNDGD